MSAGNPVGIFFACLFQTVKVVVLLVAWCVIILCVLTKRR